MVADLVEAAALEEAMHVMVELHRKGDKPALQKHIALALSCVARLNKKHDTVLSSYRDHLDRLETAKSEYKDAAVGRDEKRYSPSSPPHRTF